MTGDTLGAQVVSVLAEAAGTHPDGVTAEELTVLCWQKYPRTFGLKGFENLYPNHTKVASVLAGKRGLVSAGFVRTLEREGYVTRYLPGAESGNRVRRPAVLTRPVLDSIARLEGLVATAAVRKYPGRATVLDALEFFDCQRTSQLLTDKPAALVEWLNQQEYPTVALTSTKRRCLDVAASLIDTFCKPHTDAGK